MANKVKVRVLKKKIRRVGPGGTLEVSERDARYLERLKMVERVQSLESEDQGPAIAAVAHAVAAAGGGTLHRPEEVPEPVEAAPATDSEDEAELLPESPAPRKRGYRRRDLTAEE